MDDPQQWREYGLAGRGFAIGFAPALFAPIDITLHPEANENLHVGRVLYGDAETKARPRRGSTGKAVYCPLSEKLDDTHKKVEEMHAILLQARGARWVIVGLAGVTGLASGLLAKLVP